MDQYEQEQEQDPGQILQEQELEQAPATLAWEEIAAARENNL